MGRWAKAFRDMWQGQAPSFTERERAEIREKMDALQADQMRVFGVVEGTNHELSSAKHARKFAKQEKANGKS